jgi:orotate phosphoribosyltransferase-like protein
VDGESRLIVATKVTNCAADVEELIPMVERAEANTEEKVGEVLADSRACSDIDGVRVRSSCLR